jgi:hypothetical protein
MRTIVALMTLMILFSCEEKQKTLALSKIKSSSKLTTTEAQLTKMIFASQEKKFLGFIRLNEAEFAARTKATITAGVDLSKITDKDIDIKGKRISVRLPAVQVTDFSYPFSSYEIDYTITHDAFANSIDIEKHEELYRKAELQIRDILPLTGLRETTENNTKILLEKILNDLGYEEVYITFKEGDFIEPIPVTDDELL